MTGFARIAAVLLRVRPDRQSESGIAVLPRRFLRQPCWQAAGHHGRPVGVDGRAGDRCRLQTVTLRSGRIAPTGRRR